MDVHLGIKEADGSLDDGGQIVVGLGLEDVALGVGDNGLKTHADILGLHIEGEGVEDALGLACRDDDVLLDHSEVAQNEIVERCILGSLLGREKGTGDEGDLDGAVVVVGELDQRRRRAAVDELNAKDVGIGERGGHIGIEDGGISGRSARLSVLVVAASVNGQESCDAMRVSGSCSLPGPAHRGTASP